MIITTFSRHSQSVDKFGWAATTFDGIPDSGWYDSRILLLASSEKGADHHYGPAGHRRQNQWSEYHGIIYDAD